MTASGNPQLLAADSFFTSTWSSGVSGVWSDPANWTSVPAFAGYPQSGGNNRFTAVLTGDGLTHAMDVPGLVDALNLDGGINATSTVMLNGTSLSVVGAITTGPGSRYVISGTGSLGGPGGTRSTIVHNGSTLSFGNGAAAQVSGLTSSSAGTLSIDGASAVNVIRTGNTGTANAGDVANLNGSVIQIQNGSRLDSEGLFTNANGSSLFLANNSVGSAGVLHNGDLGGSAGSTISLQSSTLLVRNSAVNFAGNSIQLGGGSTVSVAPVGGVGSFVNFGGTVSLNGAGNSLFSNVAFDNSGRLQVDAGSEIRVINADFTAIQGGTLKFGFYDIAGRLSYSGGTGTVVTNNADVTLRGPNALFVREAGGFQPVLGTLQTNNNKLALEGGHNLVIGSPLLANNGLLIVNGGSNLAVNALANPGSLTVGTGSHVSVTGGPGAFQSLDQGTGALGPGRYDITGRLAYDGVGIQTNNASITLNGPSALITNDFTGNSGGNALAGLTANRNSLTLNGATLTTTGDLSNVGQSPLAPATLGIGGGGAMTVNGSLANGNFGNVNVGGSSSLAINGSLTNANTGNVTVDGGALTVNGDFNNAGDAKLAGNTVVAQTLTNTSFFDDIRGGVTVGDARGGSTLSAAIVDNQGSLIVSFASAASGATQSNAVTTGSLANSGFISLQSGSSGVGARLTAGTFTNNGFAAVSGNALLAVTGALTNAGDLFVDQGGSIHAGTLSNSGFIGGIGAITVDGTFGQSDGLTQVGGTLTAGQIDIQGGKLSGGGTITADTVTIGAGATLAPGDPQHMSIIGDLDLLGTMVIAIGDPNFYTPSFDTISVDGNVNFDGLLTINLLDGFLPALYQEFVILTWTGTLLHDSLAFTDPFIGGGMLWSLIWDNADRELILQAVADSNARVPEPAGVLLLLTGIAVLFHARRRRAREHSVVLS